MAKPTIKFDAVAYNINGYTGYRPQLEAQIGIYDLDFCKEVVTEKRLSMSADELLHAIEMVGEVGPSKVALDGRPRGITKLLKYNRFAKGNLDSPTSNWNASCRAYVKPQLMNEAEKDIDATFVNINDGINVKLNYVAWLGAKSVTNVVKIGKPFAAYGNHMEWLDGDKAVLIIGTDEYELTCTDSDVAHAVFAWPAGLEPEEGTAATFRMASRGGVVEGEVYTSKKGVTVLAGDTPLAPTVTKLYSDSRTDGKVNVAPKKLIVEGTAFASLDKSAVKFDCVGDEVTIPATATWTFEATRIIVDNGNEAITTGGAPGDDFSVTVTKPGCEAVKLKSELV